MSHMDHDTPRFYTLDLMRGFAALSIVLYHLGRPNQHGYLAVDLFFVLSGFVLTHSYGDRLYRGGFMLARLLRLYPMFIVGAGTGLLIRSGSPQIFFMIPDWNHRLLFPANTALWSVAFEMIASIGFAVFYRFGFRIWSMFWIGSGVLYLHILFINGHGSFGFSWLTLPHGLLRMIFSFTSGIALFHIYRKIRWRFSGNVAWLLCILPVAIGFFPKNVWVDIAAIFFVFPIIVIAGALIQVPARSFASWCGGISYPLYAIHQPIVVVGGWAMVPIVVILAAILDKFYDRPVRRILKASGRKLSPQFVGART